MHHNALGLAFFETGFAQRRTLLRHGITRVGDVTGLDHAGLPVWCAYRPNSRALSVSMGKGLTHKAARLSATMEALENDCAEDRERLVAFHRTIAEMSAQNAAMVPFERLARIHASELPQDETFGWVAGYSYRETARVHAPYELIGMDLRYDANLRNDLFTIVTLGLGAGQTRDQAILHALLELIENDATASIELFGINERTATPLALPSDLSHDFRVALQRTQKAGIDAHFFLVKSPVKLATIGCVITSSERANDSYAAQPYAGYACRLDPIDAAQAAFLEAVQSRLTNIAGAREDIEELTSAPPHQGSTFTLSVPKSRFPTTPRSNLSTPERIPRVCETADISDMFVFPLAPKGSDFAVVRLLVPGLGATVGCGPQDISRNTLELLLD